MSGSVPFGFAGGIVDRDTALIQFGARDYDPSTGRWLRKELLGFAGSENFYQYAGGDPVNFFDPDGRAVAAVAAPEVFEFLAPAAEAAPLLGPVGIAAIGVIAIVGAYEAFCDNAASPPADFATGRNPQGEIDTSGRGLQHATDRHTVGGAQNVNASTFNQGENLEQLVQAAETQTSSPQGNGNFQTIINAGRDIGIDRATGNPTQTYTVIDCLRSSRYALSRIAVRGHRHGYDHSLNNRTRRNLRQRRRSNEPLAPRVTGRRRFWLRTAALYRLVRRHDF